jgi:hypothetical protein
MVRNIGKLFLVLLILTIAITTIAYFNTNKVTKTTYHQSSNLKIQTCNGKHLSQPSTNLLFEEDTEDHFVIQKKYDFHFYKNPKQLFNTTFFFEDHSISQSTIYLLYRRLRI